jgi:hypothetical protein
MKVGKVIFSPDLFEKGSNTLTSEGELFLSNLTELIHFNRFVKLELLVSAMDTYCKTYSTEEQVLDKKGKKTKKIITKTFPAPSETTVTELVDKRVSVINSFVSKMIRNKDRILVTPDYKLAEPPTVSKNKYSNLLVVVKDLKNSLD